MNSIKQYVLGLIERDKKTSESSVLGQGVPALHRLVSRL